MSAKDERLQILEMIDSGVISAGEAARLLRAIEGDSGTDQEVEVLPPQERASPGALPPAADSPPPRVEPPGPEGSLDRREFDAQTEKWRRWWMIPLWVGTGITVLGGLLMLWAFQATGFSFWFGCAWLPFLFGLGVMLLAWSTRTSRWLHLRVRQKPGDRPQTIALSFPLPLRLASGFLRLFGRKIPTIRNIEIDEILRTLESTTGPQNPFFIEVDDGEDGEKVQIYIG
jgi:hypothetical protein